MKNLKYFDELNESNEVEVEKWWDALSAEKKSIVWEILYGDNSQGYPMPKTWTEIPFKDMKAAKPHLMGYYKTANHI